ncbi:MULTISPECIES: GNAT family N-acetyltransferase [unclassified Synechocystis]|uniref:GNAT family N-acetyltransferase n=1 Tax=unclassified Synechocystis TaxID=2640012 RepID=UPI00041879D1|nr:MULTISPECIES: GNAT family N-acetyltransferase [unclassified Synechocystis]AIE74636.1 GCN5-related N-acetyltransferase [Synechocystis sp. PCC 6714]MCT0254006.1 GNAT family N-acetyltransferase [Synechocystis sp. CS-94]
MAEQKYLIRTMAEAEIALALDWAAAEGWNPGCQDADCFYQGDRQGFLLGLLDGEPIATISAVKYNEEFGFIGFYIVKPEYRSQGYGWQIWQKAMAYLQGCNIGLDGVLAQQANYQKSGFHLAYRNIRYQGVTGGEAPPSPHLVPLHTIAWKNVLTYDGQCFSAPREEFLRTWCHQRGHQAIAYGENGILRGYGVVRPCRVGYKIGPLFADTPGVAETLFLALKANPEPGAVIYLDVPEPNQGAIALAAKYSLQMVFETARMYTGQAPPIALEKIYGVTSFELG